MKSDGKRNFEVGFLIDDAELVGAAMTQFDNVWIGCYCKTYRRRYYCGDPIT